jgi:hypothetical protein
VPSDKELRLWVIGIIVGAWLLVAWIIADQFVWTPHGTPVEILRQTTRRLQILTYVGMAGMVAAVTLMTRMLYFLLRSLRETPGGHTYHR